MAPALFPLKEQGQSGIVMASTLRRSSPLIPTGLPVEMLNYLYCLKEVPLGSAALDAISTIISLRAISSFLQHNEGGEIRSRISIFPNP